MNEIIQQSVTDLHRVSITARGVQLPERDQRRASIVDALGEQVALLLQEEYGLIVGAVVGTTGHQYTQVEPDCPTCGTRLRRRDGGFDAANGASETATCPACGWAGRAVYRLIDLEALSPDTDAAPTSAVASGAIQPHYHSY